MYFRIEFNDKRFDSIPPAQAIDSIRDMIQSGAFDLRQVEEGKVTISLDSPGVPLMC